MDKALQPALSPGSQLRQGDCAGTTHRSGHSGDTQSHEQDQDPSPAALQGAPAKPGQPARQLSPEPPLHCFPPHGPGRAKSRDPRPQPGRACVHSCRGGGMADGGLVGGWTEAGSAWMERARSHHLRKTQVRAERPGKRTDRSPGSYPSPEEGRDYAGHPAPSGGPSEGPPMPSTCLPLRRFLPPPRQDPATCSASWGLGTARAMPTPAKQTDPSPWASLGSSLERPPLWALAGRAHTQWPASQLARGQPGTLSSEG